MCINLPLIKKDLSIRGSNTLVYTSVQTQKIFNIFRKKAKRCKHTKSHKIVCLHREPHLMLEVLLIAYKCTKGNI